MDDHSTPQCVDKTGRTIEQIRSRGCAEKYRDRGEPVHLIGVEFSRVERNLVAFDVETLPA